MDGDSQTCPIDEPGRVPGERRPLTVEERQVLVAQSRELREQAVEAVARCMVLRVSHDTQAARLQARCDAFVELRARLCDLISEYSVSARRLDLAPEGAIVLIKDLLRDPVRPVTDLHPDLWDDVVWWTVESYFAA